MTHSPFNWHIANKYNAVQVYLYDTPAGQLVLLTQGKVLCSIEWLIATSSRQKCQPLPENLKKQLDYYWLAPNIDITLPLLRQGTAYQQSIWTALRLIPVGQTKTYGELAKELKTGPRALANACRNNPFPLIIPCHRVLAKSGIGGYAGAVSGRLIDIKKKILQHEKLIAHEL